MASKKELKDIINAVCFDIIDECLTLRELNNLPDEKVTPLLNDTIALRNDLITRVNQSKGRKAQGKELKTLRQELENKLPDFIDQVNALA